MDIVLGVSMTPTAVRMVLVEGDRADGVSVDHHACAVPAAGGAAPSGAPEQVIAALLGTRESVTEDGHRMVSVGVAWTDHADAARLSEALRAHGIEDVVLVSELHAASALAQAIGQTVGADRIALLFIERDTATLAVVRTIDATVVKVASRSLRAADAVAELRGMVAGLETADEPPEAVFMVGSGVDIAVLRPEVAAATSLPVHAPADAELALARGAALASANTPRYETSTVGLASAADTPTAAGVTQMAPVGYPAPLGYSAVADDAADGDGYDGGHDGGYDGADDDGGNADTDSADSVNSERKPLLLIGSAVTSIFVFGVAALAISLAIAIEPTADQRPNPGGSAVVSSTLAPAQAQDPAPSAAPETIQAPVPVVQQGPRTVFVTPRAAAPAAPVPAVPVPVAPMPAVPIPVVPVPVAPIPAVPIPVAPVPVAPVPVVPVPVAPLIPPIVVPFPVPVIPQLLPPFLRSPVRITPLPQYQYPSNTATYPRGPSSPAAPTPTQPSFPTATPDPTSTPDPSSSSSLITEAPSFAESDESGRGSSGVAGSSESQPLWPFDR